MKNILIAPNSFKQCADSVVISQIIKEFLSVDVNQKFIVKPLTDGGDGFLSVYNFLIKLKPIIYSIYDDYGKQLNNYKVLYNENDGNIYIESAELFGMKRLHQKQSSPLELNSEILGKILLRIKEDTDSGELNVEQVNIGVGGTATIDFGIGACSQLGLKLFDDSKKINNPTPQNFDEVKDFEFSKVQLPFKIVFIVDVDTPLFGEPGAIEIYGKQKGASDQDLKIIKSGFKNILNLITKKFEFKIPSELNGAGGGVASGISLFYDAEIIPAKEFIKKNILNDIHPEEIDALITGEGKFDFQSFEGKGIGVILELFENFNIPKFIICGISELPNDFKLANNIIVIELQKYFNNKDDSIKNYKLGLAKASELIKSELKH